MDRTHIAARCVLAASVAVGTALGVLFVMRLDANGARGPQAMEALGACLCAVYGVCSSAVGGFEAIRAARTAPRPPTPVAIATSALSSHIAALAYAGIAAAPAGPLRNLSIAYAFFTLLSLIARASGSRDPESGKELV